jgi:hypothetical protein
MQRLSQKQLTDISALFDGFNELNINADSGLYVATATIADDAGNILGVVILDDDYFFEPAE